MASAEGVSVQGFQVIASGVTGSFAKFLLYLPDPTFVRPSRLGYYWYGASASEGAVSFLFAKDSLTSWGVAIERANVSDPGFPVDTLVVDWNQPGVVWRAFW